jgi:hypothetical protein
MTWQQHECLLTQGHQVASGLATDSPYPAGTIALQTPHFQQLGLDLSPYFAGTLNLSLAPKRFTLLRPSHTFVDLQWHPDFAPETFSFYPCRLLWQTQTHYALIYYPHPETKLGHFQDDHTLEVIAPPLPGICYGDRLKLAVRAEEVTIK